MGCRPDIRPGLYVSVLSMLPQSSCSRGLIMRMAMAAGPVAATSSQHLGRTI